MTITYETAKKLKEFLGEGTVEPIDGGYYQKGYYSLFPNKGDYPAYSLEDLLSKPFLESFWRKTKSKQEDRGNWSASEFGQILSINYFYGGIEAVEKCLLKMIKK